MTRILTRQNTDMVKDTNAATSMLAQEASRLQQLLSHFRLANSTTLRAVAFGLAPTSGAAQDREPPLRRHVDNTGPRPEENPSSGLRGHSMPLIPFR